ncbi:MAG: UDP-glucose 4-epimerase [bacterium ADurb.Bin400]|nr:MAG: UDP-glucose 4-epimerase [bacterium ADurb.Bin400]
MKTVLVTGGAGYIGSFTVKELLDQDYKVVVLDSLENGHLEAVDTRASLEVVDIADKEKVRAVFNKYTIDAVIDFAAYLAVGESMEQPVKYMKNNVENFVGLLDVMREHGCRYIIKSSTASTYGNPPEDKYFPLKESYHEIYHPSQSALLSGKWDNEGFAGEEFFQKVVGYYNEFVSDRPELSLTDADLAMLRVPASIYGLTKMFDEIILDKYDQLYGVASISLRYFNVCGAALNGEIGEDKPNPTTLMTVTFWHILGRIPELQVFGNDYPTKDGTGVRDYIHPLDLATGHIAALRYLEKTRKSEVFNLGTGDGYSVLDVIYAVEKACGKTVKYSIKPRQSGDPAVSYADPSKAKMLLGWRARYDLADMANTAWKWHSNHPRGYIKNTANKAV